MWIGTLIVSGNVSLHARVPDLVRSLSAAARLRVAPGGGYAVLADEGGLAIVPGGDGAPIALPARAHIACLANELWALDARGGGWWLERRDLRGALIEPARALEVTGDVALVAARGGAPSALVVAAGAPVLELHLVGHALAVAVQPAVEQAVPLAPRHRIERRDGRLWLRRPAGAVAIDLPPERVSRAALISAAPVFAGAAIAIELAGEGVRHVVVINARHGKLLSSLRTEQVDEAVLIGERDHLVLRRGRALTFVELRTQRVLAAADAPDGPVAFDPLGRCAVRWDRDAARATRLAYDAMLAADRPGRIINDGNDGNGAGAGAAAPGSASASIAASTSESAPITSASIAIPAASASHLAFTPDHACSPAPDATPGAAVTAAPDEPAASTAHAPPPRDTPADFAAERARLARVTLHALDPADDIALDPGDRERLLAAWFALVVAWCRRALAEGWDSGRITADRGDRPFAREAAAILDAGHGIATAEVTDAIDAEVAAGEAFRAFSRRGAPHVELARRFDLSPAAITILLAAAAPQVWPNLARIYGIITNDPGRPLGDEHLIATLLGHATTPGGIADELDDRAPLVRHGLVTLAGARPFRAIGVPRQVVRQLLGDDAIDDDQVRAREPSRLEQVEVAPGVLAELIGALARPSREPLRLVLRGRAGTGRRTLAAALAAQAGRRLGLVELGDVAPAQLADVLAARLRATALRGWIPCVSGLDGSGAPLDAAVRAALDRHDGPIILRLDHRAGVPQLAAPVITASLPALDHAARIAAWRAALARRGVPDDDVPALAARFAVSPGTIDRVAEQAAVARAAGLDFGLERAVRGERAVRLRGVAEPVTRLPDWSSIVLPPDTLDAVRGFVARVRHRRRVLEDWGMQAVASTARGLTALFQGAPGTGKTLVAGAIARALGYELYRVDLSQIMSKWLGETQKNLAALFDAAEEGECVLLFDEADALFTRRTEVRSSNDRYANLEVNFLLQRLDSFEGIALLTTNFGTAIDAAFRRRMSVKVTFPFPDEEARRALWAAHLPPSLPVAGDLALDDLARRFQLSGGYIRNAALRAVHLAADEDTPVTADLLVRAVRLEMQDIGKLGESGALE